MIIPIIEVKDSDLIFKLCQKVEKINVQEKNNYLFNCYEKTEKDFDFF